MSNDCGSFSVEDVVYLKQYGAERTGTNYLKRLIELNFSNAVVFGSVLGWKHGLYETQSGPDPECASHAQWLEIRSVGDEVYSVDGHLLPWTRAELQEAIPKLNYVISTKGLRSWVHSYKRFRAMDEEWNPGDVARWCRHWLSSHERWAELLEARGGILVEFEGLLRDINPVLEDFESRFRLTRTHRPFVNEPRIVKASTDLGLLFAEEPFDPTLGETCERGAPTPKVIEETIASFQADAARLRDRLRSAAGLTQDAGRPGCARSPSACAGREGGRATSVH
jgi:hypothetical protein